MAVEVNLKNASNSNHESPPEPTSSSTTRRTSSLRRNSMKRPQSLWLSFMMLISCLVMLSTFDFVLRKSLDSLYPRLDPELSQVRSPEILDTPTEIGIGNSFNDKNGTILLERRPDAPKKVEEEMKKQEWSKGEKEFWERQRKRMQEKTDIPVEKLMERNIEAALKQQTSGNVSRQNFLLHIQLLAGCDKTGTKRSLDSLKTASYGEDFVQLTVVVNCSDLVETMKNFSWTHGSQRVLFLDRSAALDPLRAWWPQTESEHLFYLSVQSKLSPGFYTALKATALQMGQTSASYQVESQGKATNSRSGPHPLLSKKSRKRGRRRKGGRGLQEISAGDSGALSGDSLWGFALDPDAGALERNGIYGGVQGGARMPRANFSQKVLEGSAFLSHTLADGCQLVFPEPWTKFWRWHAVAQGPQVDSAEAQYDAEAYDFSETCRRDWQASFATYAVQENVFNLYAGALKSHQKFCISRPSPDPITSLHLDATVPAHLALQSQPLALPVLQPQLSALPRLDQCGRTLAAATDGGASLVARSPSELRKLLEGVAVGGAVAGVMASGGYEDMLMNWMCYVKELSLRNFFIITQDPKQAAALQRRGIPVYLPSPENGTAEANGEGQGKDEGEVRALDYGSVEYKRFILARTRAIGQILHAGFNVLLADVDAIWLADPFQHFGRADVDMFAQLEERGNPCGGFLYLTHSPAVLLAWDLITAMFTEHIQWLASHRSRKDPQQYRKFLASQQHNHEQTFLQEVLQQGRHHVRLQGLDPLLFINGRDYFDHKKAQLDGIVPVMIHNNYIVGKANKTRRFKIKGMWRLDGTGERCKCLTLSCDEHPAPWANVKVKLPKAEVKWRLSARSKAMAASKKAKSKTKASRKVDSMKHKSRKRGSGKDKAR